MTLKHLIDTCADTYANIMSSKASKEIYCRGSPLRTSVSDMKYTITVFLSYDHGEITTAQRSWRKLQSARSSFMADRRHLVTRRRRLPNFCDASRRSADSAAPHCPLFFTVPKFGSSIIVSEIRRMIFKKRDVVCAKIIKYLNALRDIT